jgi:hypothetical protein
MIVLKIILLILLADFATGVFHFYADRYGIMDGKFLTSSINGLLIHHFEPRKMLELSYWNLTKGVYIFGSILFLVSLVFGFHWEVLFFVLVSAQANLIHKWSHQMDEEIPIFAKYLQNLKIIQDKNHHVNHHDGKYEGYYCVMTNYCNPILEKIYFWEGVVKFFQFFGITPVNRINYQNK